MQNYHKFIELLKEHYVRFKPKDDGLFDKANGFDNYLSIKNKHFQVIESFLNTQKVSNDIANKLYDFFSSYLNASGTPFFIKTPLHKNIYAPVYNNSDDVSLFYKTKDLYYVKTDTIYKDISLEYKNYTIKISAQNLEQKKDNNKISKEISLEFISVNDNLINFNANFKADSDKNYSDIKKEIQNTTKLSISEDDYKAIKQEFKKQNMVDFFIHKNAEKFLKEQFDLFIYHYFYKDLTLDTKWSDERLEELKNLKLIAYKIIELIAKLENEILRIWLKPKFAKNVNYVFSLDLLKDLQNEIKSDDGFKAQCDEWAELGMKYESFNSTLPLDTKHFSPRLREKILSHFDNLSEILNGEIIKSDNFNALNTLKNKYRSKVKCIYIDPPYNTTNDDFIYFDKFNHATWLSFMRDRLVLAREFLRDDGAIFVQCDDNEQARLKLLMDEVFGEENFVNCITWKSKGGSANPSNRLDNVTEWILWYSKNHNNLKYNPIYSLDDDNTKKYIKERFVYKDEDGRKYMKSPIQSPNYRANLIYDYKGYKTPTKGYSVTKEVLEKWEKEGKLVFPDSKEKNINRKIYLDEYKGQLVGSLWNDIFVINPMSLERLEFGSGQKPEKLIQRILEMTTNENDIVMDFHLGSGTTAAVAHKMNRRYIGVELGEYFYTTTMPRLKKVVAAEQGGISKALDFNGGGAFVYYELESYEEALRECEYTAVKEIVQTNEISLIDYKKSRKLIKSLDKNEKLYIDLKHEYFKDLDIFVSFANIYGLSIISYEIKNDELYINTSDKKSYCMKDLDLGTYAKLRDYLWWKSNE